MAVGSVRTERRATRRVGRAEIEQANHEAYIDALLVRQRALIRPTVELA
jgi:hypothetical protein